MVSKRRFEMVEGSSAKFWEITVDGASFTVGYGRIGTAGQQKTTACASASEAQAEADKLIREKTKKGYTEAGAAKTWRPPVHIPTGDHVERFMNYLVTDFDPDADPSDSDTESGRRALPALRELERRVFAVRIGYDDDEATFGTRLDALLADPRVGELRGLVIGVWYSEVCEAGPTEALQKIAAAGSRLKALEGLFVGDVVQEESEISWMHQSDHGPVLRALPHLKELVVRGGNDLRFTQLNHPSLERITVQTGGLSKETLGDLLSAQLPELRSLVLWFGTDDYGGDCTVADLEPLLSGKLFPKLEHLGLQDSPEADSIAAAVARSPLLARLTSLDLSMGTLSDVGADALLASPHVRSLKHLNIRHHYVSPGRVKQLEALGLELNARDRQTGDEEDRYVEVAE